MCTSCARPPCPRPACRRPHRWCHPNWIRTTVHKAPPRAAEGTLNEVADEPTAGLPGPARRRRQGDDDARLRRADAVDDGVAAAGLCAGPAVHAEHRHRADGDDGLVADGQAAGLRGPAHGAAGHHPDAAEPERGVHARGADGRPQRPRCRRQGDRILRPRADRRQLRGRPDRLRHPGGHQLRGGDQGRRAYRRGRRALHFGRHARQADGDRRRSELPASSIEEEAQASAAPKCPRKPISTGPWTVRASSCAATRWPAC